MHALISGAGKGIGEATAILLASQGASVVVCDLDGAAAQSVADTIRSAGGQAEAVAADVTSPEAPARMVSAALTSYGGIDIMCAGEWGGA